MSDIYFVLKGLVNGEEGVRAFPAGGDDTPVQPDGWYFLPIGATDGEGPFESREAAKRARDGRRRYFLFLPGELPREIAEDHCDEIGDGNVVIVHPADESRREAPRRYQLACYYDDSGVWEFVTTMAVEDALVVIRAALEVSP